MQIKDKIFEYVTEAMSSKEKIKEALMAYRVLYPDGPEPRAAYCVVSEKDGFVQINKAPGYEVARITYKEIDEALDGIDLETLKSNQKIDKTSRDKMVADILKRKRYKVVCLKMREKVDQLALENCLNENSRDEWTLKSITQVNNFSLASAALSGVQKNFELVVVFERG